MIVKAGKPGYRAEVKMNIDGGLMVHVWRRQPEWHAVELLSDRYDFAWAIKRCIRRIVGKISARPKARPRQRPVPETTRAKPGASAAGRSVMSRKSRKSR